MSLAESQLINKILTDKDYSIVDNNYITEDYFYQFKDEFCFIRDFYKKYKCVPDKETFSSKFFDFNYFSVGQNIESIVGDLREQKLFQTAVSVINGSTELFEQDANKGVEFLLANINKLQPTIEFSCTDIMHDKSRFESWKKRQEDPDGAYIPIPLEEMNESLFGFQRGEELFLWLAKSGGLFD